jgi:SOS response regulatory protein OraA/RecX
MIAQTDPMQPIEIARFVGLKNTRVIQILEGAQAKAIRALSRRGFDASNIDDLFLEGFSEVSYWK